MSDPTGDPTTLYTVVSGVIVALFVWVAIVLRVSKMPWAKSPELTVAGDAPLAKREKSPEKIGEIDADENGEGDEPSADARALEKTAASDEPKKEKSAPAGEPTKTAANDEPAKDEKPVKDEAPDEKSAEPKKPAGEAKA